MTTLFASGISLRGSTRRSKVSAIQAMSPCAPSASHRARRSRASVGGSVDVTRQASKPSACARALRTVRSFFCSGMLNSTET